MYPTPPTSPKPNGVLPEHRLGIDLPGPIRLTDILGVGAYGTVYKACDLKTGVQYAVKALNKTGLDDRQRRFQEREIQLHYQASQHPNVVSLVKIMDSQDCTFVVMEYCPEGDLFAKITEEGHYVANDSMAKRAFLQILDAVEYCHSLGIYHRDLKPENIMVSDDGNTVKLADFGLATQDHVTSDFGCGSTFYMSPECQQANPKPMASYNSAQNDIWSLGVILVNLVCGRNPWKRACAMSDSTYRAFNKDPTFLQSILPISGELNCILQRIFEINPRKRISLSHLRSLIMRCPRLSQETIACCLPPSPPATPPQDAMDCSPASTTIAPIDQFSGLNYPACNTGYLQPPHQTAPYYTPPHTPPGSGMTSPQHTSYTFAAQQSMPATSAVPTQTPFVPSAQMWSRCSQFIPAFTAMPRPACFWNGPVY